MFVFSIVMFQCLHNSLKHFGLSTQLFEQIDQYIHAHTRKSMTMFLTSFVIINETKVLLGNLYFFLFFLQICWSKPCFKYLRKKTFNINLKKGVALKPKCLSTSLAWKPKGLIALKQQYLWGEILLLIQTVWTKALLRNQKSLLQKGLSLKPKCLNKKKLALKPKCLQM